jgi:hypothetical protein
LPTQCSHVSRVINTILFPYTVLRYWFLYCKSCVLCEVWRRIYILFLQIWVFTRLRAPSDTPPLPHSYCKPTENITPTNSVQPKASDANGDEAGQQTVGLFRNSNICDSNVNINLPPMTDLRNSTFPCGFSTKIEYAFLVTPDRTMCPGYIWCKMFANTNLVRHIAVPIFNCRRAG